MTKVMVPAWAIAMVDGVRADVYFGKIKEQLREANHAYKVMHQTYKMTHVTGFRDAAQIQAGRIRNMYRIIGENANLYSLVTTGRGLN